MDGALPPIPAQTPPQHPAGGFPSPTGPAPAPRSGGLVGRPSNDEAQQEARVVRTQELRRLEAVLPKQATDSKIQITRISGGDGRRLTNKPVMTILISDLEEAVSGSGITSEEYITEQLRAKFNEGKFKCQVFDRAGKVVPGVQAFVLSLDEEDMEDDDDGEGDDEGGEDYGDPRGAPTFAPPPPPATFGAEVFANQSRREREEERGRSNELLAIMMNAQQANQQMMTMFMQQAQQQQAAQAEAARQAAESAAARSSEMWKVLITAIAPIVGSMLQPKESTAEKLLLAQMSAPKGMSPEMQMLIDIVKGKGDNAPQMMSEMLKLQNAAASSAIETQAKLTASVIDSTLSRMKELQNDRGGNDGGGGTLESIAKIAGPVIAAMMARNQGQQAEAFDPAQQQAPAEQPPALPAPAPEAPAPRRQRTPPPPAPEAAAASPAPAPAPAPAAPAAPPTPPVVEDTDDRRIQSCLLTVAQMSTGKVPPPARWDALRWCLNRMPATMLDAIKASKDDEVLKLGTNAVLTEPRLIEWFTKPASEGFLREAISDMRLLALNQLTPEMAQQAIQKQAQWVAEQSGRIAKPAEKPAEPPAEKPAEPPAPPAESNGPEEVVPPAEPPAEAKPKGRKRRTPPPAAAEG